MLKKLKEDPFYFRKVKEKDSLNKISKENIKEIAIYLSENQMFNSQHHYLMNNILNNLSEENKIIFIENIVFSYNKEANISINKILKNQEFFNCIKDPKAWFEKTGALHYLLNGFEKIRLIEKYNIDLNVKNKEGYSLISSFSSSDEVFFMIEPKQYIELILKNKNNISFQEKDFLERNIIENVIKMIIRKKGKFIDKEQELKFDNFIKALDNKKITISENFLYKNASYVFMKIAMENNILLMDKTKYEISSFSDIFIGYCATMHFLDVKDFKNMYQYINDVKLYKIKKKSEDESKLLNNHIIPDLNNENTPKKRL